MRNGNELTRRLTLEEAVKEAALGLYVHVPVTRPPRYGTHLDIEYVESELAGMVKDRIHIHCFTQADSTPEERLMLLDVTPNMQAELDQILADDKYYYVESDDT
jgi:hypothetical protein